MATTAAETHDSCDVCKVAPFRRSDRFYVLLTPPLFDLNFGGVPLAPDRPCWASTSAWALSQIREIIFEEFQRM